MYAGIAGTQEVENYHGTLEQILRFMFFLRGPKEVLKYLTMFGLLGSAIRQLRFTEPLALGMYPIDSIICAFDGIISWVMC